MAGADVIVVGAGAAGIAAARRLHEAGLDVLLVEAGDRVGGRAHSITVDGFTLDLGCGWLHSAKRNPWTKLAAQYGFTVDRTPANWRTQWRNLGFTPEERIAFSQAWQRWEEAAHKALDGPDRPLSDFIAADDPKTLEELSQVYGVSLERDRQIEVRAFEKLQKAMMRLAGDRKLLAAY